MAITIKRKHEDSLRSFLEKLTNGTDCLEWQGAKNDRGYGQLSVNGKVEYAHRYIYQVINGDIPDDLEICHHCDNPSCVRPRHLFIGSHSDNMQDAGRKGLMTRSAPRGEDHVLSQLTEDDVKEIRKQYALGISRRELRMRYNVGRSQMQRICTGQSWQHLL